MANVTATNVPIQQTVSSWTVTIAMTTSEAAAFVAAKGALPGAALKALADQVATALNSVPADQR